MKSDEIYDGVNAIDAVRDVLNACRSEESVKDASYSYVVTKTNTARELLGDFLDVILKEEYKDAYKKDKTAKEVTDWWYCVTNFPKQENEVFDSDKVIRTAINAPNRLTKRMSKQYYRKALCIAWSDTYMNNNDSDPADAWTAYYTEQ